MSLGPLEERFWARVRKSRGCWLWSGEFNSAGYGRLQLTAKPDRTFILASRLALQIALRRELAANECALHHCDNPPCVRVGARHLFVGTRRDNSVDMSEKRRAQGQRKRVAACGHCYTKANTAWQKGANGRLHRRCRECRQALDRRRRAEKAKR